MKNKKYLPNHYSYTSREKKKKSEKKKSKQKCFFERYSETWLQKNHSVSNASCNNPEALM